MPIDEQFLEQRFGEIRQRHSGKSPFGVLDDLGALHDELSPPDRQTFWRELAARRHDEFWGWFAGEFVRHRPRPLGFEI